MEVKQWEKPAFTIIGKQGSTSQGPGFIQRLWEDANGHFDEVAYLAKSRPDGRLCGIWGAMSDESLSFAPWEEGFTKGLYLAGVEAEDGVQAPKGWTKWRVPGFVYLCIKQESGVDFAAGLRYLQQQGLPLAGAVQDFTDPGDSGQGWMLYPIRRLEEERGSTT